MSQQLRGTVRVEVRVRVGVRVKVKVKVRVSVWVWVRVGGARLAHPRNDHGEDHEVTSTGAEHAWLGLGLGLGL